MTGTAHEILFGWLESTADSPSALFDLSPSGEWCRSTYDDQARLCVAMAHGLVGAGAAQGDVIVILATPGPKFVAALFGVMLAGGTPAVLAPPRAFDDDHAYRRHLAAVAEIARPRLVVTAPELSTAAAMLRCRVCTYDELLAAAGSATQPPDVPPARDALVQFTSGSSGSVRAVRVPYEALAANVVAIREWLDWSASDTAAFWVPPYHDMGLIGGLFAPLASRCDVFHLTPEQFVRRPRAYLECFGRFGARLTALPAFGLDYIVRRVRRQDLEGLDFSGVKGLIVGAEPIDVQTLVQFQALLAPNGLRENTLLPAYGLAEATLAVSGVPLGTTWSACVPPMGGVAVVGCGRALPGVGIEIVDDNGQPVGEGEVGEIVVRGSSVAAGYLAADPDAITSFRGSALQTGDAAFVHAGQLFPLGRFGDAIKLRGRTLFAERLEGELQRLGYDRSRNVVLLGTTNAVPAVVWIAEADAASDQSSGRAMLARLAEGANVVIVPARRGAIARTSSGKPRRRVLWNEFVAGRLASR